MSSGGSPGATSSRATLCASSDSPVTPSTFPPLLLPGARKIHRLPTTNASFRTLGAGLDAGAVRGRPLGVPTLTTTMLMTYNLPRDLFILANKALCCVCVSGHRVSVLLLSLSVPHSLSLSLNLLNVDCLSACNRSFVSPLPALVHVSHLVYTCLFLCVLIHTLSHKIGLSRHAVRARGDTEVEVCTESEMDHSRLDQRGVRRRPAGASKWMLVDALTMVCLYRRTLHCHLSTSRSWLVCFNDRGHPRV